MGKEEIAERILSDARAEAEEIVDGAKKRAEEIVKEAQDAANAEAAEAEGEAYARAKFITDGKASAARLESQKIVLAEKRRVIDGVYLRALAALLGLEERDSVRFAEKILKENAEEGDEIVFSENFAYAENVAALPVVREKKLTVSGERRVLSGGFILRGKKSDKDVSYGAVLAADREKYQADIARAVFGTA